MLFKQPVLKRIASGEITLAFRRWQRPSVKSGGTLLTPVGVLNILNVQPWSDTQLTARDARRAGFDALADLQKDLGKQRAATLFRIEFRYAGEDPRVALREADDLASEEVEALLARLDALDRRSALGPWTRQVLQLIACEPRRKAGDLAAQSAYEKEWLKRNICKLKNLGLTESLNPGYRLSPRGQALLDAIA